MFFPTVPLPDFNEVLKALFRFNASPLDKTYLSNRKPFCRFYSRGSDALACISKSLGGEGAVVFVPSYFCNGSLDDLRNSMAKIVFYKTNMDLTPDWKHVKELSEINSPDIFVLTHYFGMVNDIVAASFFASETSCKLIHDCAHHLLPCNEILNAPGVVLFSPHKVLPLSPLSFVLCNDSDFECLNKSKYCLMKLIDFYWLIKRIIQKYLLSVVKYNLSDNVPELGGEIIKMDWSLSRVSKFSKLFFSAACSRISAAANIRVFNYKYMHEKILSQIKNSNKFHVPKLDISNNPYVFLLSVPASLQEEIHTYMRRCNIPVNTWPDLPPEVISNPDEFGSAIELRKTMLLFPVHQDITAKEINYISNKLLGKIGEIELACGN